MGVEVVKKPEVESHSSEPPSLKDVEQEKSVMPTPPSQKVAEQTLPTEKKSSSSIDRDAVLGRIETEKKMSLIKAWEESEKTKAENKAQKKMASIAAWENSKKAAVEAKLKKIEEELEKQKAKFAEKVKNKMAMIHKDAEEKRALVEVKHKEKNLKTEETAVKCRAAGHVPKKGLGCFGD
ncbi:Remorin C-terminal protein [Dioscorea alata]|uniref:Remorin C-terminal protein n=1 Tax=Dioscorea alata TaxID=55571 RepID=A0ACB7WT76_DIOAL|nr:Remorin C-terminal protein [Dioscorea alata]